VIAVASVLLAALLPLVVVWLTGQVVDLVANSQTGSGDRTRGLFLAAALGSTFAAQRVLIVIQANSARRFAEHVGRRANEAFLRKVASAPLADVEDPRWQDRVTRASRSLVSHPVNLVHGVLQLVAAVVTSIGMLAFLATLSPLLAGLALLAVVVSFPLQRYQAKTLYDLYYGLTSKERERFYVRSLITDPGHGKELRAYNLEEHLLGRHAELVDVWISRFTAVLRRLDLFALLIGTVSAAVIVAGYLLVVSAGLSGELGPGPVAATIGALTTLISQLSTLSTASAGISEDAKFLDDYFAFLAEPPVRPASRSPALAARQPGDGIRLEHVSFRYPGTDRNALEDLTLHIRSGELLALVGANGAGKSTIVKLLLRLYEPTAGRLYLDGVDLRDVPPADLRDRMAVLFQDFTTYELSVRDNVRFGRIDRASGDAEVRHALTSALAGELVATLPRGLDSTVGRLFDGGQALSGGERQRLALARLVFRDADIWILDEPTSALDAEAEAQIFARSRQLLTNRTGLIVSHRFSTVRMADRIAVIEAGRLTELGSHQELLARHGRYAELFERQAAGYR
jgi:ATP-binding cassette subfamily B protein